MELIDRVDEIVASYKGEKGGTLISVLQDVQADYNYLPPEALKHIAKRLEIPLSQVFSVSTFYTAFSLEPRGRHLINVCMGTACHVRGAERIVGEIERDLGIKAGETTEDLQFTLKTVNCLGACALGPIMVVDEEYHGQMTSSKVNSILKGYKKVEVEKL